MLAPEASNMSAVKQVMKRMSVINMILSMPLQAETGAISWGPFKGTPGVHVSKQWGHSLLLLGST